MTTKTVTVHTVNDTHRAASDTLKAVQAWHTETGLSAADRPADLTLANRRAHKTATGSVRIAWHCPGDAADECRAYMPHIGADLRTECCGSATVLHY